jgi:hypothetical protein
MADLNEWNVVDADNDAAPPNGWPENTMTLPDVNDAGRQVQGAVRRNFADMNGSLAAAGVADAYTLTLNANYSAYFDGLAFVCSIPAANTGPATINVNGISAQAIQVNGAALTGGEMSTGGVYIFSYDGTNVQLLNPDSGNGTVTSVDTGTGLTGGPITGAGTVELDTGSARNVDHSAVDITAGAGLSGGGTIDASRTLNVDLTEYTDGFTAADLTGTTEMLVQVEGTPRRMAVQDAGANVVTNTGTTRTSAAGDANSIIVFSNASPSTYTFGAGLTTGEGKAVVVQARSATVTLTPSGVTFDSVLEQNGSSSRTVALGGTVVLYQVSATRWALSGRYT